MNREHDCPVLIVDDELHTDNAAGSATRGIVAGLHDLGLDVIEATTAEDGRMAIVSNPELGCLLLDWDLAEGPTAAQDLIHLVRSRSESLPIFLLADQTAISSIPVEVLRQVNEYVWKLEDTQDFIAGRADYAYRA